MKIAVIGAMEEEVELLREQLNGQIKTIANIEFVEAQKDGHTVILVKSGIGKVNAALSTTLLLQTYQPDIVINTGSAGGLQSGMQVGTVVISTEVVHHDVDVTAFGYALGQVPRLPETYVADDKLVQLAEEVVAEIGEHPSAIGLIGSGDVFMSNPERVQLVQQQFPTMIAAEMEAAAVAQVCHQFGVPFVVIRALSDIAGEESSMTFEEFLPVAVKHSSAIVLRAISKL